MTHPITPEVAKEPAPALRLARIKLCEHGRAVGQFCYECTQDFAATRAQQGNPQKESGHE